jgi:hypothetical protein
MSQHINQKHLDGFQKFSFPQTQLSIMSQQITADIKLLPVHITIHCPHTIKTPYIHSLKFDWHHYNPGS